ncbi:MAG: PD40 domain-containing protein [Lentisphaeria bacterium]|nr:PD40 domain-containing protein [Lentisphaeria bacterium]
MKKTLFLLTAAILLAAAIPLFAQSASGGIVVTADAKNANPTLVFAGGLSDQALSAKILSDFQYCGWFTVLKSGTAAYHVSAKGNLQDFTVTISNSAGVPMHSFRITDSKEVDAAAHTAVDTVLNKIFGIQGICRSKVVFSAATSAKNREIFICDFDGSNIKQITHNNTLCVEPVWAPDGKSFVYSFYGPSYTNLVQYNLETGLSRRLTQYGGINAGGSLSTDGKTLAMILSNNNQVDLYTRPTEGGKLKQLSSGKPVEASPRWSPDGKKLCFVSDARNGRPVLCVIDPFAGGKATEISGLVGSERVAPSWSTDNKIAYCAKINRNYELRVAKLSADGKSGTMEEVGVAGNNTFQGEDPSWAPDNRHVTMTVNGAIYVIDTRLGAKRKLVSGSGKVGQSNWSPILK